MNWFSDNADEPFAAAVVDIGSGSVGIALVLSQPDAPQPEIIWSYREYSLIKDMESTSWSLKEIETALVNAFLRFSSEALPLLQNHEADVKHVTQLVAAIAAPWSYTVTKTITYAEAQPFTVTESLIEELSATAHRKALESLLQEKMLTENGVATIETQTIAVVANGYTLTEYDGVTARDLCIYELSAHAHKRVVDALEDARSKILPRATLHTRSFMMQFYMYLHDSAPDTDHCCLVDVTSEATEIGIVRDDILHHTTNSPYGSYSLAREIAALTKVPKEVAYTYLRGGETFIEDKLSTKKLDELKEILASYRTKLTELFSQTGDRLAIPKDIFIHCDADTERFFIEHIAAAAKAATGMTHAVHPISSVFVNAKIANGDTPILLSASEIHRNREQFIP